MAFAPAAEIDHIDVRVIAAGRGEDDAAAIRGEARGEGHAGELPEHFLPAGIEVEQIDPRFVPQIGHEGDLLRVRVEARRQRGEGAIGQEAMVLPILVHDGEAAGAAVPRAGFGHIDNAGVEVALLPEQPFIDHIADEMGDAAPIGGRGGEGGALDLRFRQHVPQPELDPEPVPREVGAAGGQRLGADDPPVLEARLFRRGLGGLDEGGAIDRAEQPAGPQIIQHHPGDVAADALRLPAGPGEIRHRDRDRVGARPGDIDHRGRGGGLRAGRQRQPRRQAAEQGGAAGQESIGGGDHPATPRKARPHLGGQARRVKPGLG